MKKIGKATSRSDEGAGRVGGRGGVGEEDGAAPIILAVPVDGHGSGRGKRRDARDARVGETTEQTFSYLCVGPTGIGREKEDLGSQQICWA